MSIKQAHYSFKRKLNKVDSQKYRNLLVPEIDTYINEARELFVKMVAMPRRYNHLGFETTQRATDDIRLLVEKQTIAVSNNVLILPPDYWFFLAVKPYIKTDTCPEVKVQNNVTIRQHDDNYGSVFDISDYNWRVVNGVFEKNSVVFCEDNPNVQVVQAELVYLRKLKWVHNAEDHKGGTYKLPGGASLTGFQDDDELTAENEIVDIAVKLATGEIETSQISQQYSSSKLSMNHLI